MEYNFPQLKRFCIFATVVEQGSFASAAKLLGMSRPAVSDQVALLEKHLEMRLLQRSTRKLSLTLDGEKLYPYAANINNVYFKAVEALESSSLEGRVRITTTVDFATQWLTPKLIKFADLYPDICIDLLTDDGKSDLISDQIDLAIRIGTNIDDGLIARPLFKEKLKIYAAPTYLAKHPKIVRIQQTSQHRWIVMPVLYPNSQVELWKESQSVFIKPRQVWKCISPTVMVNQIQSGLGIGMAFPTLVEPLVSQNKLKEVLPSWHGEEMTFSLVYTSRRHTPKRVEVLKEFLLNR